MEARSDMVQDEVDQVVVSHLGIDMESINITQVFLDSTCLFEITDLVESSVWLIMVTILLPNGVLDLFPSIIPVCISFPTLQCFSFHISINRSKPL